jgi:hypothetical protein
MAATTLPIRAFCKALLATLLRAVSMNERFTILAPSEKKAQIIMGYIIDHAFDSPMITQQLELDNDVSLDRLRRERSP